MFTKTIAFNTFTEFILGICAVIMAWNCVVVRNRIGMPRRAVCEFCELICLLQSSH